MILVDTSVWIDYFNGQDNPLTDKLDALLTDGLVVMGDLIYLEILQGFKSDKHYQQAKQSLSMLEHYELFGHGMAVKCADNFRALRKQGITIRRTTDLIIATFCIDNKIPLLYADRDFEPFAKNLALQKVI